MRWDNSQGRIGWDGWWECEAHRSSSCYRDTYINHLLSPPAIQEYRGWFLYATFIHVVWFHTKWWWWSWQRWESSMKPIMITIIIIVTVVVNNFSCEMTPTLCSLLASASEVIYYGSYATAAAAAFKARHVKVIKKFYYSLFPLIFSFPLSCLLCR